MLPQFDCCNFLRFIWETSIHASIAKLLNHPCITHLNKNSKNNVKKKSDLSVMVAFAPVSHGKILSLFFSRQV